jgi:GGDEF domain-containing protein
VREAALQALAKLESSELGKYAESIANRLEDTQWRVREVALHAFGKIEASELARHASVLIPRIAHSEVAVRIVVLQALGKLEVFELAKYASQIATRLEDFDGVVRTEAGAALARLKAKELIKSSREAAEIYLRHSAKMGAYEVCQELLVHYVDFSKEDSEGKTAIDHARQNKHQKIVDLLSKAEEKRQAIAAGLHTSEITKIANRRQYDEDMERIPPTSQLCIFSLDMANLKVLNEEKLGGVGHDEADKVLEFYAKELESLTSKVADKLEKLDMRVTGQGAYHMHGDEFCAMIACETEDTQGFIEASKDMAIGIAALKFEKEGYPETYFRVGALCRQDASYDLADKLQEYTGVKLKRDYPSRDKAVPLLGRCNWKFSTEGLTASEKEFLTCNQAKEPEKPKDPAPAPQANPVAAEGKTVFKMSEKDVKRLEDLQSEVVAQGETIQCQRQEIIAQREVIEAQREVIEALKARLTETGWRPPPTPTNGVADTQYAKMSSIPRAQFT